MNDIFLSYDRTDQSIAQKLADALKQSGWSVFWDYDIRTGVDFEKQIESELKSTGCVVVLWSRSSVKSKWVKKEARGGAQRGRLLPLLIDEVALPAEFRALNAVQLSGWDGQAAHPGFKRLLEDVVGLIGGEPFKRSAFETALSNIAQFGDTDVLPFPVEKQIFSDKPREALELLQRIDAKFADFLGNRGPYHEASLYPVGPFGYRWVTQIDPIWNAYLLGLVTAVGRDIEKVRAPAGAGVVFSYRFDPSQEPPALFDQAFGYRQYQEQSLKHAEKFKWVLACDIADFYPRISHARLKHALDMSKADQETAARILQLLDLLSQGTGFGLPVGGPAARLLSELALSSVNHLLMTDGIPFCRFADDYHIFADGQEQAYEQLMLLSRKLFEDQGLILQKSKTRIMSSQEFAATSPFAKPEKKDGDPEGEAWGLFKLKIKFDPYAQNSVAEYEKIRKQVEEFDVEGLLSRELAKSQVDPALTRQLVKIVRFLKPETRNSLVQSCLLKSLPRLYPLLSHVFRAFRDVIHDLEEGTRREVFDRLGALIRERSYLTAVPAHLACAVRVLAHDASPATDTVLAKAFENAPSSMVRRDIILAMARRGHLDWINNLTASFPDLTPWERRALLISSHILGSAGRRWRQERASPLSPLDLLVAAWADDKMAEDGSNIPI